MQKRVSKKYVLKKHIPSKKERDRTIQRQKEYHKEFVRGFQKHSLAGGKVKDVKDLTVKKPKTVVKKKKKKKKLTLLQKTKKRLRKVFGY
ncbi:hypothetical protein LCGC14_0536240 [marine sediment metagenome]|uniref:Uncharacterized protein n=1 Tax=marine sediment metagenome TaxID=412755 RepID=A0A0F9SCM1_9ZZZZ